MELWQEKNQHIFTVLHKNKGNSIGHPPTFSAFYISFTFLFFDFEVYRAYLESRHSTNYRKINTG